MKARILLLAFSAFLVFSTQSFAATVLWNESINGDRTDVSPVIFLTNGANELIGGGNESYYLTEQCYEDAPTACEPVAYNNGYDLDTFLISIPDSITLESIIIEYFAYHEFPYNIIDGPSVEMDDGQSTVTEDLIVNVATTQEIFSSLTPMMGGIISLETTPPVSLGGLGFSGLNGSLSYTITLNASSIPIPSALWLFAPSLFGLITLNRKHCNL